VAALRITGGEDVVAFLKSQHQQIRELFERVRTTSGPDREHVFTDLRRLLAVHETAEEEIVHPRARWRLGDGDAIVTARLHEEEDAKRILAVLEKLDVDSTEFAEGFVAFQDDVLAHADAEETQEFPQLRDALDESNLARMRTAVRIAEKTAPTRPHPGVELAGQNMLVGPFAAMLDRARDLLTGKL
jgi:hemerythrin superfamily protein